MLKPVDFICPNCDRIKEELVDDNSEHDDAPWCESCAGKKEISTVRDGIVLSDVSYRMIPIFSPKKNRHRWRFRD